MRVLFMGTPDFAVPVLEALHACHDVIAVYTQPPRDAGRGQRLRPSPVALKAEGLGLQLYTPKSLKKEPVQKELRDLNADVAVVAAYGLILPQAVLDAPRHGCINVHASLLPRWRGAAPIQRAIMAGDTETGVTIMQMDAGLDTGDMLLKETVPIDDRTTAGHLHDALSALGARLITEVLESIQSGTLDATPQPGEGVTYADKIEKAEAAIDFDKPALDVIRHINGLSPFPGAYVEIDGMRLKILMADVAAPAPKTGAVPPGTVLDSAFTIACGNGAIRPTLVQRSGKKPTDTAAFLRGFELRAGARLG